MEFRPPFLNLSKNEQKLAIEALLFAAQEPLSLKYLFDLLIVNNVEFDLSDEVDEENETQEKKQISLTQEVMQKFDITHTYFLELINEINIDLVECSRPYQIVNIASGYQFATRPEYGELLQRLTRSKQKRRFSHATLEALSIIAYKQPVTKPEIEQIRGVNSNEIVNSLLEKKLIKIAGRKDALGKPLLYGTTKLFLKVFGLKSIDELPKLREIEDISSDDVSIDSHVEYTLDISDGLDVEQIQKQIEEDYNVINENDDIVVIDSDLEIVTQIDPEHEILIKSIADFNISKESFKDEIYNDNSEVNDEPTEIIIEFPESNELNEQEIEELPESNIENEIIDVDSELYITAEQAAKIIKE